MQRHPDRREAGRTLAHALGALAGRPDVVVLGIPRGGVPVAFEVAEQLGAPLDVLTVRKLGAPTNPEFAIGAVGPDGVLVLDDATVSWLGLTRAEVDEVIARERRELARRDARYRGERPRPELADRTVVIVDDGLATGHTMAAAVDAVRAAHPARVISAVPVAARDACERLRITADECVCVLLPEPLDGVGHWYVEFPQTTDAEVIALLDAARTRVGGAR
jgi:putative phosphoribosyl transferase